LACCAALFSSVVQPLCGDADLVAVVAGEAVVAVDSGEAEVVADSVAAEEEDAPPR